MKSMTHTLLAMLLTITLVWAATAQEKVKVGVLHSLTGTMAISEVSLRDVVAMAAQEINAAGGVLGKQIELVEVDPASDWDLFAEKAKQLLEKEKVSVTFGCWTSVSRKSVLPVYEQNNGLLFYPVQYEGEECSPNIVYTGATPNQQLIPAAEYLMSEEGGSYKKFYLLGTDYVFPRTANKILRAFLLAQGVPAANVPFYTEFAGQGLKSSECPIMAFSVAEDELRAMDTKPLVGHLAAWNYFQFVRSADNKKFVKAFKQFCATTNLPGGSKRVTDDPIVWSYTGVYLWKAAVEKAGSFDVDKVKKALYGLEWDSPGGKVKMDEVNHHLWKPVMIGEVKSNGQFKPVWQTEGNVRPNPWSKYTSPDKDCDHVSHGGTYTTTK